MNKVTIMGRLTKDVELKYTTNNNTAVASFTLAVDRRIKKEGQQQADFINIVAWDNQAEFCSKYFSKGQKMILAGRLQTRTWDDTDGKKHYVTEVVAEEIYFADSKKSEQDSAQDVNKSEQEHKTLFESIAGEPDELPF